MDGRRRGIPPHQSVTTRRSIMLIVLNIALAFVAYVTTAFVLASFDICFTFGIEGAAKAVMRGGVCDRILMWWRGHYLNQPGLRGYNPLIRTGEVLRSNKPDSRASQYAWWQLHWKFLELLGIYWYGLWPFKKIYNHEFEWVEQEIGEDGKPKPKHRKEFTDFIYVKNFPYWVKLPGVEDATNEPLNLDYLLTVHINNPYWALFMTDDWLKRTTADSNNCGKIYVGSHTFNQIKTESSAVGQVTSDFATVMCGLSTNLVTEPGTGGTRRSYGVTINGAALVSATPAGIVQEKVQQALVAKRLAELNADATVAAAEGEANATRARAKGQADAIDTVYGKVEEYGELGLALRQLDTMQASAASPNTTVIWANNPLGGLKDWFGGLNIKTPAPTPPAPPPETTPA
jgi:hypothetical protein